MLEKLSGQFSHLIDDARDSEILKKLRSDNSTFLAIFIYLQKGLL
jgi:hypothetical protein